MPFRPRYFQPGPPVHATPVHLQRLPGMRQQFVVNVSLFRSRSPRPMARRPPPLRLLPSQASTQSERAHATATRLHTHRKRSKAPLAIGRGVQRVLKVSLRASLIGDCVVASPSSQYFAASRAPGLGAGGPSLRFGQGRALRALQFRRVCTHSPRPLCSDLCALCVTLFLSSIASP
jgi:hypothetical protein